MFFIIQVPVHAGCARTTGPFFFIELGLELLPNLSIDSGLVPHFKVQSQLLKRKTKRREEKKTTYTPPKEPRANGFMPGPSAAQVETPKPPRALLPSQMTQISLAYLALVSIIT